MIYPVIPQVMPVERLYKMYLLTGFLELDEIIYRLRRRIRVQELLFGDLCRIPSLKRLTPEAVSVSRTRREVPIYETNVAFLRGRVPYWIVFSTLSPNSCLSDRRWNSRLPKRVCKTRFSPILAIRVFRPRKQIHVVTRTVAGVL